MEHPNLVKLVGYCAEDDERGIQRLLVYEYMARGSLEDYLFRTDHPVLSWEQRLRIILGSAQGLTYLHEQMEGIQVSAHICSFFCLSVRESYNMVTYSCWMFELCQRIVCIARLMVVHHRLTHNHLYFKQG